MKLQHENVKGGTIAIRSGESKENMEYLGRIQKEQKEKVCYTCGKPGYTFRSCDQKRKESIKTGRSVR